MAKKWRFLCVKDQALSFAIFERKLVFAITSKISIIPTEHIELIFSLESGLSFDSIYSLGSLNNLKLW